MAKRKMDLRELEVAFIDLEKKSVSELKELFRQLSDLEEKASNFRKSLHEVANELRAELVNRLAASPALPEHSFLEKLSSTLENFPVSCRKSLDEIDFSSLFTTPVSFKSIKETANLSLEELEQNLFLIREKEAEVSYVRRLVHGWLDVLKRELERRLTQPETSIELILQEINKILVNNF